MVKNALQAQLLKAGLVDAKQAKKANKHVQHAKKTGQDNHAELQAKIAQSQQEKQQKDQALVKSQYCPNDSAISYRKNQW